ncbi:MAG: two-component system sensor histidine kinase CreC [Pseudomonadales bacterium]|nr:two-component system sensor histidine kinase CreC [Pseudomonadales bacterium]
MSNPEDPLSTVMYVAAPIYAKQGVNQKNIIGVLTVYTPNLSLQPFLELSKSTTLKQGLGLILITTIIGGLLSYWLSRSISKIVRYAQNVGNSKPSILPKLQGTELNNLAQAIEQMRIQLEGKNYVENYVQALTHELKSPIAAIKGSIELMSTDMPNSQHEQFSKTIFNQAKRLEQTIDQMLKLAALENIHTLETQSIDIVKIINNTTKEKQAHADIKQLKFLIHSNENTVSINVNQDLLLIAINNLIDNALDFAEEKSTIEIEIKSKANSTNIIIKNQGEAIPDFAKAKLFDRFYSLPRPNNQPKSTGLGLSFVRQIMDLHQGLVLINNLNKDDTSFVLAVLVFPK